MDYKSIVRTVPDFPKPGILFYDLTTLWENKEALFQSIEDLCAPFVNLSIDKIIGIESRGFILGSAMAYKMGTGFIPIRKKGKLPYKTISESFDLEYGSDVLFIHEDSVKPGEKVIIVDDLLATGGTLSAAISLIKQLKGDLAGIAILAELTFLKGREKVNHPNLFSLIQYDGKEV